MIKMMKTGATVVLCGDAEEMERWKSICLRNDAKNITWANTEATTDTWAPEFSFLVSFHGFQHRHVKRVLLTSQTTLPRISISLASITWAIFTSQHLPGNPLSPRREYSRKFLIEPIPYSYAIKVFTSSCFLTEVLNFLALWSEHFQRESNL